MSVLLINIYPLDPLARYLLSSYALKAYLDKMMPDLKVDIINYPENASAVDIATDVKENNPSYVGYSCYVWNITLVEDVIGLINTSCEISHILGGPEISVDVAELLLKKGVGDYFVIGEGEKRLFLLLKLLMHGGDISTLKGVMALNQGKIHYCPDGKVMDLSEIPSVYRNKIIEPSLLHGQKAYMETQRGCKYRCFYCVYHKHIKKIHYYPIGHVIEEITYLVKHCKVRSIRIFDAVFTSNMERAKKIVHHLNILKKERNAVFPWIYWEFHYLDVDEEFVEMVAALKDKTEINNSEEVGAEDRPQLYFDLLKGYNVINGIGVQSFNPQALKAVGRAPMRMERFCWFMEEINNNNVLLKIDIILGLPFENGKSFFEGLEKLLPFVRKTDHIVNIHHLQILPGSTLAERVDKFGIEYFDEAPHYVYQTNALSREEMRACSKLSALLFRVVNSPLRELFFASWPKGVALKTFLEKMFDLLSKTGIDDSCKIFVEDDVYDTYWNHEAFCDIPSQLITEILQNFPEYNYVHE